jgi:hypothetical protein
MDSALKFWKTTGATMAVLVLLAATGISAVYSRLPPDIANFIVSLRSGQLSRLDRATLERGYYEDLTRVNRFNDELWKVYMSRPNDWLDVTGTGLTRFTGDFLQIELMPSFMARTSWSDISTNRWGMRDKDYSRQPASGVYRIALLGASLEMGWGVADHETYETLVESMLNDSDPGDADRQFEILNFSVPGFYPLQQMASLDRAFEFEPNTVVYVAHGLELTRAADYLFEVVKKKIDIPYPELRDIVDSAGVTPGTADTVARRMLAPYRRDILSFAYSKIARSCGERGIIPVLFFFEHDTSGISGAREIPETLETAREAGLAVIELEGVYDGYEMVEVQLAEWDNHPNALGHRLVAEKLFYALTINPELLAAPSAVHESD